MIVKAENCVQPIYLRSLGLVYHLPPSFTSLVPKPTPRRLALAHAFNLISLDVLPYCHIRKVNLSLNIQLLLLRTQLHFLTLLGLSFRIQDLTLPMNCRKRRFLTFDRPWIDYSVKTYKPGNGDLSRLNLT
jgi:hypothetical protein